MKTVILAGLLSAAIAVPVLAQPTAPMAPMPPRAPMGAMADGVMTRAEVQAQVQAQFVRRDVNRDGVLTQDEVRTGQGMRRGGQRMAQRQAMPMRDPGAAFDRLDTNRDGVINRAEFGQARQTRVEKRRMAGGAMRGQRGGAMGLGGHMFAMADANRDGRVTLAEAHGAALRHFDMIDRNRDGQVTRDERRAGREQMRQMRQQQRG